LTTTNDDDAVTSEGAFVSHSSHPISADLISAQLSDPVSRGCDQSDKTARPEPFANWVRRFTAHSLPLSSDETRNAWQSLACNPRGPAVSPSSE